MAGLPEIEVIRRDLEKEIVGRRVKDAEIRPGTNAMKIIPRHGRRKEFQDLLEGAKIEKVSRLGKRLLLDLDNEKVLVIDLGLTGRLHKTSASDEIAAHTHIVLSFTIGGQLRMLDPKRASEIFVIPKAELEQLDELRYFQIDPLENPLAWQTFSSLLESHEEPMKELLMDDTFICGLGEVYSDEVLFVAGIRHDRPANQTSSQDVRRLYRALTETMQEAVKARGTTFESGSFTDLQGEPGRYQLELKVFELEGEPCRRCRSQIIKEEIKGRYTTYFCPQCQS